MKVCIVGDSKFEIEIDYVRVQLEDIGYIVYVPLHEYKKEKTNFKMDIDYYTFEREYIYNSDYILLIGDDKKDRSFVFSFGVIFGTKKKFKVLSIKNIKNLSVDKFKECNSDGKTSGE
jgi:hypothetical protein